MLLGGSIGLVVWDVIGSELLLRNMWRERRALTGPCPRDTVVVVNCCAVKRLVIDYGDLRQGIRAAREKKTDYYDWAEGAIASYFVAEETLRERYLEKRLPGERMARENGPIKVSQFAMQRPAYWCQ